MSVDGKELQQAINRPSKQVVKQCSWRHLGIVKCFAQHGHRRNIVNTKLSRLGLVRHGRVLVR